jgi:hypothetical protein
MSTALINDHSPSTLQARWPESGLTDARVIGAVPAADETT